MHPEEWPDVREMFLDFETSPEAIYDHPLPTTEEKAQEQVKVWSDSGYFYSVCLKGISEVIGYLCFCGEQLREMGYSFKKKYHAVVDGSFPYDEIEVEKNIKTDEADHIKKMICLKL